MAHVQVTINGRQFRMACDDGQENHLLKLAEEVNGKVDALKGAFGEIGDTRLTVMAAIMIADELAETRRRLAAAEEELSALRRQEARLSERDGAREAALAAVLEEAAEAVEHFAARLSQPPGAAGPP